MHYHFFAAILLLFTITQSDNSRFKDSRDDQSYSYVQIGALNWMSENLRYRSPLAVPVEPENPSIKNCGMFYPVSEAFTVCPEGWRLPTENEVKALLKLDKKGRLNLTDTLKIELCGRVDYGNHGKAGQQNTFWIDSELEEGHITHWHTFGDEQEMHSHNVVNADRKFPVRCVCEVK